MIFARRMGEMPGTTGVPPVNANCTGETPVVRTAQRHTGETPVVLVACVLMILLSLLSVGCVEPCPDANISVDELVGGYNANASKVDELWARADISLTVPTKSGIPITFSPSTGKILLFKCDDRLGPQDFVLLGRQAGAEVFRLGSSAAEGVYYLWYGLGDDAGGFIGQHKYAGARQVKALPIDPNQLLSVLGICEIPSDRTTLPTVAMAMNREPGKCAYVLTYIDRLPISNEIVFKREMFFTWSKEHPPRLFKVNFFDGKGLRIMTANLKDYVAISDAPCTHAAASAKTPAAMPTDIRISWTQTGYAVHLKLSEISAENGKAMREIVRTTQLPRGAKLNSVDGHIFERTKSK